MRPDGRSAVPGDFPASGFLREKVVVVPDGGGAGTRCRRGYRMRVGNDGRVPPSGTIKEAGSRRRARGSHDPGKGLLCRDLFREA